MDVTQSEPLPLLLAPYSKVEHRNNYHPDHQQYRGRLIVRSLNLILNQTFIVMKKFIRDSKPKIYFYI